MQSMSAKAPADIRLIQPNVRFRGVGALEQTGIKKYAVGIVVGVQLRKRQGNQFDAVQNSGDA